MTVEINFKEFTINITEQITCANLFKKVTDMWISEEKFEKYKEYEFPIRQVTKDIFVLGSNWTITDLGLFNLKFCGLHILKDGLKYCSLNDLISHHSENGLLVETNKLKKLINSDEYYRHINKFPENIVPNIYSVSNIYDLIEKFSNKKEMKAKYPEYFI